MEEEEYEDDVISTCDECGCEAIYHTNIGDFCVIHRPF